MITRKQVETLRRKAASTGDLVMVTTCDKALAFPPSDHAWGMCERVIQVSTFMRALAMRRGTDVGTIEVDYENNAEEWWDEARSLAASMKYPDFTRVLNAIERGEEMFSAADVEAFVERASKLPGWEDGPRYARNPVLWIRSGS